MSSSPVKRRSTATRKSTRSSTVAKKISPAIEHSLNAAAKMALFLAAGAALFWIGVKMGTVDQFISPLLRRFGMMKDRGLIILMISKYCLLTFVILPVASNFCVAACAKKSCDLSAQRAQKEALGGIAYRVYCAHLNMVEGLALMCAAVFSALLAGVADAILLPIVAFYMIVRVLFSLAYALDLPEVRSSAYMAGVFSMSYVFYLAMHQFCLY